ncbi:hypothetical protein TL18_03710 [Methanobrevibacter sp. YE315]|uniref:SAP domain-containing protein n=1 Tax=Methanobrevibacter sp. YE315 TaxID=1609968 RepID=UPI000764D480|nr:SAP domain-containing protein [Methanobrevibacter sp. YE315]AMD17205.1 hypothetical protein TL18_03710 [Methanobrevibacter sp. YE315]
MTKNEKALKDDEEYLEGEFDAGREALTAEEVSEKYTVAELKYILKENGLKVSGKKQELVERVLPILNNDSSETSGEDVADDSKATEKAKTFKVKKVVSAETEDYGSEDDESLLFPVNDEMLSSVLSIYGINYEDLPIKDKIFMKDNINLNIQGFTQNGIIMSDSTMSIVAASDSSNIDLKMNIPEVSYSDFESTIFTFKDLDLSILPSSSPQTLEFSAIMDSLEIITETNYVNLKGLNLFFKSFADERGVRLDIDIKSFIYPDLDATIKFEDLDFNLSIGLDGQSLDVSVNLPKLNLLNKNYRVDLSDLNLNILLPDTEVSSLDLSILMSDFHYTNFDDVVIDMDNVDVSLEPISDLNNINVIIRMDGMDAIGLNSFDELFPMMNITSVTFKNPTDDSESLIKLTALMSLLDIFKNMDLISIGNLLSSGFDLDTYTRNMSDKYKRSSYGDVIDISGAEASDSDDSGFDLGAVFANCDYSGLSAIELDLTGLLDSLDIDLAEFGIDVSDYDLSSISLSDLIDTLSSSDFVKSAIAAVSKLFSLDFDGFDMSSLVVSFDVDNFDPSGLLDSLNLSGLDISGIMDMFSNLDLGSVFKNCDYSCLGAIKLDLTGLLDSLGIDLAEFGIDVSGYDLSAISLADVVGIVSNLDFDMSTILSMLKLFGLNLDDIDLSGLIASFDVENFDISSLLASLNLSDLDIAGIMDMLTNSDLDLADVFENCDYSCLGAIVLDLTGLLDSLGIDLADLGIDLSDYDLSAISLADVIGILGNLEFDMSTISALLKLFGLDLDELNISDLVASFDAENFDLASLLDSLDLSNLDLSLIGDMFANSKIDFAGVFENCDYSNLDGLVLNLSGLIDSFGIDLADLGIDVSDYDLSAISLPDVIDILNNSDFDISKFDLSSIEFDGIKLSDLIASLDVENFDLAGFLDSLNLSDLDIAGIMDMFTNSDLDLAGVFENCDYSCLGAIVLDLSGLIDSLGIDLADLGIDVSDYDLSAISLSDIIGILGNLDLDMSTVSALLKLFGLDLDDLDLSGLISSFDAENFDISTLLESLNLSDLDISAILGMFTNLDLASIFENCDYSCLGAIVLDLSGLVDSLGIDLAEFGIDVSDYDLSAIGLSDVIGILNNADFDMETIIAMLKLFGLDLDGIDLSGLIASFDSDNFDLSALLASLNLSDLDISGITDMFGNMDVDFADIFENCDYSCLNAIVLDLSGLVDSLGIDLAEFGIDVSDYDLSAIGLSDVIDILTNSDFINTAIAVISKAFSLDFDNFDMSGLIANFDSENFDMSGILNGLDLSSLGISGISDNFDMNGFDLTEVLNGLVSMFIDKTFPDASHNELICESDSFNLESLNKLFDMSFINGQLKVCIDDELVFEGDTTDDLTQEIFEIIEECLGEHEITVEFTDSEGKSDNYAEKIVVE